MAGHPVLGAWAGLLLSLLALGQPHCWLTLVVYIVPPTLHAITKGACNDVLPHRGRNITIRWTWIRCWCLSRGRKLHIAPMRRIARLWRVSLVEVWV
jgi:hypothetical protein